MITYNKFTILIGILKTIAMIIKPRMKMVQLLEYYMQSFSKIRKLFYEKRDEIENSKDKSLIVYFQI